MMKLIPILVILLTGILCFTLCLAEEEIKPKLYESDQPVVTFGRYEQDNNLENGPEAIEWLVLNEQDGKKLIISRFGLDVLPYHTEETAVTWETCKPSRMAEQ